MANHPYLLLNWSGDPDEEFDPYNVAASANWFYPVLWFSIFSLSDLIPAVCTSDEGETFKYLSLLTPVDIARDRAVQRKDLLFSWFPRTIEPFYQQWLDLLAGIEAPFIHFNTVEIWIMSDDERSERELRTYIRAFEENEQDAWMELLEQAEIKLEPKTKKVIFNADDDGERYEMGYRLRGYGEGRDVPWDDD